MHVLFLCTGNSCRSQMAEGFARAMHAGVLHAASAGTIAKGLNPLAVRAMREVGIDVSLHRSKTVADLAGQPFDAVITVCGHAHETCPMFPGSPGHGAARVIHVGFDDPPELARACTSDEQAMHHYRRVRDEIGLFVKSLPAFLSRKLTTRAI
ncbi:MAG: arsenate reductase ArsC [Phycisphaerales bacterium]